MTSAVAVALAVLLGATASTGRLSPTSDLSQNKVTATGSTTARSLKDRAADVVNVKDYLPAGQPDGTTDNTAGIQAAITAAGQGGTVLFAGTCVFGSPLAPLARQTWRGIGSSATLYFTGSTASPAIDLVNGDAKIEGINFRSVAGFTGAAFRFKSGGNTVERARITNNLNATGLQFDGAGGITYYNTAKDIKVTSAGVGVHITGGPTPNVANNNIIDNVDVYGSVGTGFLCDGSPSQFTARNLILEHTATTAHLKVTNAGCGVEFQNIRIEGVAGSEGFVSLVAGAPISFRGHSFLTPTFSSASLSADLAELRSTRVINEIADPFFLAPFTGSPALPVGWTKGSGIYGNVTSAAASAQKPTISADGNSLEVTTGGDTTDLFYTITGSALDAAKGKTLIVSGLTELVSGGTNVAIVARADGPTVRSQPSNNAAVGDGWRAHYATLSVPSDATSVGFQVQIVGNGAVARVFSPRLQVLESFNRVSAYPSREMPYFKNGAFFGAIPKMVDGSTIPAARGQTITLPAAGSDATYDSATGTLTIMDAPVVHIAGTARTISRINPSGVDRIPQYGMVRLTFDIASVVVTDAAPGGYIDLASAYTSTVGGWLLLESFGNGTWIERQRGP
jgi:hypothetical protein